MANVFLHIYDADGSQQDERITFERIPFQGECISLGIKERWYRVERVVLYSGDDNDWDAQVFAVFIEHNDFLSPLTYS